ncbi:DinB family protein [Nocardioides sp. SOB77]|uniref:DinB family protein n=1 Tax=Nocardioides oceani TaxID=3058369 RepID=A0ABT8F9R0_9ACTN|nr:DinB family protein [Nocardioides oceani]MDN4171381.1 DinB family protein [Nocardioides oceani]
MSSGTQSGDERTLLLQFLDEQRSVLRRVCSGLTAEQLDTPLPPSDMTLGGMLKHLAYVESWWTTGVLLGREQGEPWDSVDWRADVDWDWHSARDDTPEQLWELFEREVARADEVIAAAGLDDLSARANARTGERASLRWILLHLVEEYARHCGHADLIRESIDGLTNA